MRLSGVGRMTGSVDLVLVGYTLEKTRRALAFCRRMFDDVPVRNRILVLNDPALQGQVEATGWQVLQGSNDLGEFSGWQEGLDWIRARGEESRILFINDTLASHRHFSAFRYHALLAEMVSAPARSLVGFVDQAPSLPGEFSIAGLEAGSWVSTYCFMLDAETIRALDHRLWPADLLARCVPGGTDEHVFFSDELSPALRAHLRWFLFSRNGWYRSEALSEANAGLMHMKARCICAELILSARCRELGCNVIDPLARRPSLRFLDFESERIARRVKDLLSRLRTARNPVTSR